jgi:hypothetical protein
MDPFFGRFFLAPQAWEKFGLVKVNVPFCQVGLEPFFKNYQFGVYLFFTLAP